jgi:glucose/mannose-6-phosphate isomerase
VSDPLTRDAIAAVDPQGMLADVLAQPHQVSDALWRVESAGIPARDLVGGLLVCGMGGSAIGAELAAAAADGQADRPIRAVRDYSLEPWTHDDTLALCASYSGNTEETLASFEDATAKGIPRVALTTGGELAERARAERIPVIGVPAGMQPRAAVVYMTVGALECAASCGAAPSLKPDLERAGELLARLVDEWGPDSPEDSLAKRLARRLHGTLPVIYGAGSTVAVATRWKTQLNENAKLPAFRAELPEADHNEVCGWGRSPDLAKVSAVFLDDAGLDERVRRRIDVTADVVEPGAAAIERVEGRGETLVERVLSLVLLGDLISVYLAALDGVDPTPVEPIDRLKAQLGATS